MKLIINTFVCALALFLCFSCSPESKIKDDMRENTEKFQDSDSKYFVTRAEVFIFNVGDHLNFLANDTVRDLALAYGDQKGLAGYRRSSASNVTDNPRWFEDKQEAERLDSYAEDAKDRLLDFEGNQLSVMKGGIWALHAVHYKEYLYRGYVGPYIKSFLYLYDESGKHVLWSHEVNFEDGILRDILNLTKTGYDYYNEYSVWG